MKKLLNVKNLIVALVLVVGLTGIASFVSASQPIATISYGTESINISSGDRPQLKLHEFGNVNEELVVELEISKYVTDFEVRLKSPNSNSDSMGDPVGHTTDQDGNIRIDLSSQMNPIKNEYGVYSLNFIDKQYSGEKNFSIDILVDKKAPIVKVSLGDNEINSENDIDKEYSNNQLIIEVQDESFNPKVPKYNIPGELVDDWKLSEDGYMKGVFELPEGENNLNILVIDEAGNNTVLDYSDKTFIIDSIAPNIKVTVDNNELKDDTKSYYTNQASLNVLIEDSHLDLSTTKIVIGDQTFQQNNDGTFGNDKCLIDSKGNINLTVDDLSDGKLSIEILAKDTFGHESKFKIKDFVIDTRNPSIQKIMFNGQYYDESNKYEGEQTVTLVINEENLDQETGMSIELFKNELNPSVGEVKWSQKGIIHTAEFKIKEDGEYTLNLNATDLAGNEGDPKSLSFMIDSEAPKINLEAFVDDKPLDIEEEKEEIDLGVHQNLILNSTVTDANLDSDSERYSLVRLDPETGDETEIVKDKKIQNHKFKLTFTDSELEKSDSYIKEEGKYILTIDAKDKAGRESQNVVTFSIDRTAPVVEEYVYIKKDADIDISMGENRLLYFNQPITAGVHITEAHLDRKDVTFNGEGCNFEKLEWQETTGINHIVKLPFDKEGICTFDVDVKDKAQNIAEQKPGKTTIIIDESNPKVTVDGFEELSNKDQTVNITVEDITFTEFVYTVTKLNNITKDETTIIDNQMENSPQFHFPIITNDGEDATFTVVVKAYDILGNETIVTKSFEIDKVKPLVTEYKVDGEIIKNDDIYYFAEGTAVDVFIQEYHFDATSPIVTYEYEPTKNSESQVVIENKGLTWEPVTDKENTYKATVELGDEGYYSFNKVSVFDKADNEVDKEQPTLNLAIDKQEPNVSFTEMKELSNDTEQKLTIKVDDITYKESTYTVTRTDYEKKETKVLKDNELTSDSTFVLDEFTANGTYHVKWTAFDWSGHKTEKEVTFTVDTINPVVSNYGLNAEIREDKGVKYYSKGQEIKIYIDEYHFDDKQAEINLTYQSSVNDKNVEKIELNPKWEKVKDSNNQYVATIKVEEDGYYELKDVEVTDQVGNVAEVKPQPEKFVIDKVKPDINVSDVKNDFYYKKGDKVTINVSIDETNFNPNLSTYTIYRKESLNSEEKVYLSGNITSQTDFKLPTLTENGEYRVVLTAKDMSDNQVEKDTKLHFYIDHHDPKVSIKPVTANTANGSQQNVSEVVIGLSATDDWRLANTTYTVKRNNEVINVPKQGEWEDFRLSFKNEGYYEVEIETSDEAGTNTVKETLEFTIDRTSPAQLSIVGNANHHNSTTSIKDGESYSAPRVNLQFTAQDAYSFNKITVDVTKNGQAYASQTFDVKDARKDFTNAFGKNANYSLSEEGEYEVTFTAYDQAGNQSDQKLSFEIDRTTPIITSNIEDGKYYNEDFLPEFTLDQPERDEFTFINIDGKNHKDSIPFLISDKVYTISALATDKAQNTVDYNATITIDKTNPTIGISNLITGFFKDTLSPSIFYNDTNLDASKVSIKLNNVELGAGVGDENGYTKAINIDKDGNYTLEVSIGDLATNVSKQTIDFVLDNEKPVIKIKNKISLHNQPWIPELEVLEEHGYDIVMATLNGEEYDITQPITTEGKNVLFLQVADKSGNTDSITVEFILDLTPPKVIVENAETNQLVKDGDNYETSLDLKVYLDYIEGESQEYTENIDGIFVNGEKQTTAPVTIENGRRVYHISLTEFKDYTLVVEAHDSADNKTVETITFTLGDKDIFTKIYENKPVFYSIITIAGLSVLGASIYVSILMKNKGYKKVDSSEE